MAGEFLSDIKTLRERARQHIEQGAVTESYQADLPTVLKLLNEALGDRGEAPLQNPHQSSPF